MIQSKLLKSLLAATFASFALNAVSQTADTPAGSAADTAPAVQDASSAKATRAANRKLTRSVSTALARTKGLDSTRIFVKSVDGAVTLSGMVPDVSQITLAVSVAQQVAGVKSVKNLLRVDTRSVSST
jgi:hyperosmotically inducible periplasmic protein